jgi:hypothetical protein
MIKELLVNQIIPQICYVIIATVAGIVTYEVKKFLVAKHELIEKQKQELIQKIGIDKYNQDIEIAKGVIMAVEQMGREYNWEGIIKHAKATELISQKTGLNSEDIFNIIKATVAELNKEKVKQVVQQNNQ